MTAKDKPEGSVFRAGGDRRLVEGAADLTDDERALLLAMIGVDAEMGKSLGEQERAALDKLKTQVQGYDTDDLAQAVKHVVTAKPLEDRKLEWPELRRRRRKRSPQK